MKELLLRIIRYSAACGCGIILLAAVHGKSADLPAGIFMPDSIRSVFIVDYAADLIADSLNAISDGTGSLVPFIEKLMALKQSGEGTVSILHIGDSHIQAGFITGRIREQFQRDFGDAGRGIAVPLRMTGTNEPRDYSITTPYRVATCRATEKGIAGTLGFTGVSVSFATPYNEFRIWSKSPFNTITVFHHPGAPALREPEVLNIGSYCTIDNTATSTRIFLSEKVDTVTVSGFTTPQYDDPTFYGFSLENGEPGLVYHSIGLNGAAFEHFANNTSLLEGGASALCPDLIVISLGTNNCFGSNFRRGDFHNVADGFIRAMKKAYPGIPLLLTTPMECCNKRTSRGRAIYTPNPNIGTAAEVIAAAAADNEVACWNLHETIGTCAMEKWVARGLANKDRIHLTENGYLLQGDLFYDAFAKYYNNLINRE